MEELRNTNGCCMPADRTDRQLLQTSYHEARILGQAPIVSCQIG